MKFNINDYKGNYVMHCKTEEEARDFLLYLSKIGKQWRDTTPYIGDTNWSVNRSNTVYYFNKGTHGNMLRVGRDYIILEWSDFMNKEFTKRKLKTGDVIQRRNGNVEIVNCELGIFISKTGWNDLNGIKDDLTSTSMKTWDIVKVRRPKEKGDCQFCAIEEGFGELVYERKEVEELTLEEICQLFGKEIKIIK